MNTLRLGAVLVVIAILGYPTTQGMLVQGPQNLPAERLIQHTKAFIERHPNDPHGHYTLGRINYFCFANRVLSIPAYLRDDPSKPPGIPGPATFSKFALADLMTLEMARLVERNISASTMHRLEEEATSRTLASWKVSSRDEVPRNDGILFWEDRDLAWFHLVLEHSTTGTLNAQQAMRFANEAMSQFDRAIELDSMNGLYFLTRASQAFQWLEFSEKANETSALEDFPRLGKIDRADIVEDFYRAFELSDKGLSLSVRIQGTVAEEAGLAFLSLTDEMVNMPSELIERVERVRTRVEAIQSKPRSTWVTPIVFNLDAKTRNPDELLQSNRRVSFDLDGTGVLKQWIWVKPTTGIVVWDPEVKGVITSGRQMFGSVSWWLFFDDGYRALDLLDDNQDRALTGEELKGLAGWFDRNSNGVSEPGEVIPLQKLGVVRIATRASGRVGEVLMNATGLTLESGRAVATYDWIATEAVGEGR